MDLFFLILSFLMMILGIIGCFFPIIPGPLTGWFGFIFLYQIENINSNKSLLIITFSIALLVFIIDYIMPIIGAKLFGGSKKGIIEEFNCKKDNITVIYNGLDAEEFSPIEESKRDLNRLITTASADVPLKGLDYSLKALKILKKDNPNIHLIVIGSPKKGGHTERLIKELNIKDNVFFKKHISKEEIRKLYSTSSVAIVSSLYEGFGYPVIEAMSCEVPLIATNVSSIPELVHKYAILIDPKDENLLSHKIKNVLSNYDEHKKTAIQGRQHIIKTFNWSKITNEYEKTIFKVIENFRKC